MFVYLALWIGVLVGVRHFTSVFIALLTLFWHVLAHFYCMIISSFRFSESDKHYFTVKNQHIPHFLTSFSAFPRPSGSAREYSGSCPNLQA